MSVFDLFRGRNPTNVKKDKPTNGNALQMVTTYGEAYYAWNGKLYDSDIVRACIRPKIKAIGKLVGKHLREDVNGLTVNPDLSIKFLLAEPNPFMTGQQFQEKLAAQLELNNNAFALIVRDKNGYPIQVYPIPSTAVEAVYDAQSNLFLRFTYRNGNTATFSYNDIIHLRQDFNEHDIFGSSPAAALAQLMECVGVIDQGIVKAIKNSSLVRWLLKFTSAMRPEDIKKNVKDFVDNYLSYESDAFGAAGVDAKVDAKQIEPKDYVPNASITSNITERIYSFFGVNKNIVQSSYTEDQWIAFYEAQIEPVAIQLSDVYTQRLFTRRERAFGNRIMFESNNLLYASLNTKLAFVSMVDRGAMLVNEWRATMNLAPIEGGDKPIRRLDTQVVDLVVGMINKINADNYMVMCDLIKTILKGGVEDGTSRCEGGSNPE